MVDAPGRGSGRARPFRQDSAHAGSRHHSSRACRRERVHRGHTTPDGFRSAAARDPRAGNDRDVLRSRERLAPRRHHRIGIGRRTCRGSACTARQPWLCGLVARVFRHGRRTAGSDEHSAGVLRPRDRMDAHKQIRRSRAYRCNGGLARRRTGAATRRYISRHQGGRRIRT